MNNLRCPVCSNKIKLSERKRISIDYCEGFSPDEESTYLSVLTCNKCGYIFNFNADVFEEYFKNLAMEQITEAFEQSQKENKKCMITIDRDGMDTIVDEVIGYNEKYLQLNEQGLFNWWDIKGFELNKI